MQLFQFCFINFSLIFKSENTSLASGRLLRAAEVEDLSKFDGGHSVVSIDGEDTIQTTDEVQVEPFMRPVTQDGRQLYWPRTVLKRPQIKSTSFRNSEPSTISHAPPSQFDDR